MKYFLILSCLLTLISCRKKEFSPYTGTYNCVVEEHLDSTGFNWDSTYTATEELIEINKKEMQFKELTIPYKYIDNNGKYEATHLIQGLAWGRQITLAGDSLVYFHHEAQSDQFWSIRYTGTLVD